MSEKGKIKLCSVHTIVKNNIYETNIYETYEVKKDGTQKLLISEKGEIICEQTTSEMMGDKNE